MLIHAMAKQFSQTGNFSMLFHFQCFSMKKTKTHFKTWKITLLQKLFFQRNLWILLFNNRGKKLSIFSIKTGPKQIRKIINYWKIVVNCFPKGEPIIFRIGIQFLPGHRINIHSKQIHSTLLNHNFLITKRKFFDNVKMKNK